MSDWDFLHDMQDEGYSAEQIADAAACGYNPWDAHIDEWIDDEGGWDSDGDSEGDPEGGSQKDSEGEHEGDYVGGYEGDSERDSAP